MRPDQTRREKPEFERRMSETMNRERVSLIRCTAQGATSKKVRLEAASDSCISLDAIGCIEDVSPDAEKFLQRSRDSLLHTPFTALLCEESQRLWLRYFLSYRQPGMRDKSKLVLNTGRSKRAVEVLTETSASLGTLRFIVTLQESSSAENGESRGHQVRSNLIGHIYDLVITVDRRGHVRFTNQPILERDPKEVIGTSFYDYVRPYDFNRFRAAIEEAFTSGTNTDFINEGLVCFPPGKHFRVRVKPLPLEITARKSGKTLETETAMIVFADITGQQQAEEQLKRMQHKDKRVARRANVIREEERTRLALELHDHLGQNLTVMKLYLSMARQRGSTKEGMRSAIQSAESAVDHLMKLVQELSAELRPPLLDRLGLVGALQLHLETFEKRTGIRGIFKTRSEILTSSVISMGIFRVFQETLTNVIRHSHASQVEVGLDVHRGWVFLTVSDNGRGITEEQLYAPNSLGLIGMQERAQQLGGTIHIQNGLTEGTTVVMQVPLSVRRTRGRGRSNTESSKMN